MTEEQPKLTGKQALFVKYYCTFLNATRAAELAGYKGDYPTLRSIGSQNLTNLNIKAAINAHMRERTMSEDEVLARLDSHARADMGDIINPTTNTIDWNRARELGLTHLIKEIEQVTTISDDKEIHTFKVKLHDSQSALVHIGRAYGLFKDNMNLRADEPIPIAIVGEGMASKL